MQCDSHQSKRNKARLWEGWHRNTSTTPLLLRAKKLPFSQRDCPVDGHEGYTSSRTTPNIPVSPTLGNTAGINQAMSGSRKSLKMYPCSEGDHLLYHTLGDRGGTVLNVLGTSVIVRCLVCSLALKPLSCPLVLALSSLLGPD